MVVAPAMLPLRKELWFGRVWELRELLRVQHDEYLARAPRSWLPVKFGRFRFRLQDLSVKVMQTLWDVGMFLSRALAP